MKKIRRGGITYGKSHAQGGIPVKNNGTGEMLEVEGGEGIVNKRSMASDKMVSINGKKMTVCEAVSELNQMEGGVQFSCDDVEHKQFIEAMALGGELERGTRTEKEHIETLRKLYEQRITPSQATKEVAKEHINEDPNYYSKLAKMENEMGDGGETNQFTLVIKNIKDPNEIGQGGIKNKYRGSYAKIFDILNKDNVFMEVGSIDEKLVGNDFYVTLDSRPDPSELDQILKLKNVSIANEKMKEGGQTKDNPFAQFGLKKDFVGTWEDKMDYFLKKSDNYCDVEKKYCVSNIDIDRADMPQIYEEYIPEYVDFLESQGIDSYKEYDVKVGSLHPTQKNISLPRMKRMLHRLLEGYYTDTTGKKLNPLKRVIVVTKDGYVLDGHHRWATSLFLSPNNTVDVLKVDANIKDLVPISKNFGMVEFQKFMFGGELEANKPLKVTGGRLPKVGLVFETIEWNGQEIGFYTQVGKRSLFDGKYPYSRLEKLVKALEVNYPDIFLETSVNQRGKDTYFEAKSQKNPNLLLITIDSGKGYESIEFRGGVDVRQKYFQDPKFLDALLEIMNALFFPGTGMYMPISYGKRKRATKTKINPSKTKVQALSSAITYRFKTEQEFINEFGTDWRRKVGWTNLVGSTFDNVLGQSLDRKSNSIIDADIKNRLPIRLSNYGIVGTVGEWMVGYDMLTYDLPTSNVPATPSTSQDIQEGDYIVDMYNPNRIAKVLGVRPTAFSIELLDSGLKTVSAKDGWKKTTPPTTSSQIASTPKEILPLANYRFKTRDELVAQYGTNWENTLSNWSPKMSYLLGKDIVKGNNILKDKIEKGYINTDDLGIDGSLANFTNSTNDTRWMIFYWMLTGDAPNVSSGTPSPSTPVEISKLENSVEYRFKTKDEFVSQYGTNWREIVEWTRDSVPYEEGMDFLFGQVLDADDRDKNRINNYIQSGAEIYLADYGIKLGNYDVTWILTYEMFTPANQPISQSMPTNNLAPQVQMATQNELDEKIQAIQVLLDSFTEDEIDVRRFLLNQIKELRLEKERILQAKYFDSDMRNLFSLYYWKVMESQRKNVVRNDCALDTPSGKPSQLDYTQYKLVRTPEFKNWFGDWELAYQTKNYNDVSKAINEETGEPMVMYHGKANMRVEATYFNLSGFPIKYFAKNLSYSQWFAEQGQGVKILYEFFVKVINPIDLSKVALDNITPNVFKLIVSSLYGYEIKTPLIREDVPQKAWCILRGNPGMLREIRDNTNYDGFILYENNPDDYQGQKPNYSNPCIDEFSGLENTTLDFCTFNNTQQKAADGRNTTFFNEVEDVRFAKGGMVNNDSHVLNNC